MRTRKTNVLKSIFALWQCEFCVQEAAFFTYVSGDTWIVRRYSILSTDRVAERERERERERRGCVHILARITNLSSDYTGSRRLPHVANGTAFSSTGSKSTSECKVYSLDLCLRNLVWTYLFDYKTDIAICDVSIPIQKASVQIHYWKLQRSLILPLFFF
jgi:hypothetical protein